VGWKTEKKKEENMNENNEKNKVFKYRIWKKFKLDKNRVEQASRTIWTQVSIESSSPPSVSDGIQLTRSTRRSQASHPGCMSLLR